MLVQIVLTPGHGTAMSQAVQAVSRSVQTARYRVCNRSLIKRTKRVEENTLSWSGFQKGKLLVFQR